MKKLLVTLALLGAVSCTFGQGQVTFNNSGTTLISTNTAPANHTGTWTGPATGTVNPWSSSATVLKFYYGLFVAPQGTTDTALFTFTGNIATNTTAVTGGRLTGGQPAIAGYAVGSTAALLVRGWSSNIGSTWADVQAWLANDARTDIGWVGTSGIANVALGGGTVPINGLFGATAGSQIGGFTLQQISPIPEPSSFALAGLGLAALMIFRRRK